MQKPPIRLKLREVEVGIIGFNDVWKIIQNISQLCYNINNINFINCIINCQKINIMFSLKLPVQNCFKNALKKHFL